MASTTGQQGDDGHKPPPTVKQGAKKHHKTVKKRPESPKIVTQASPDDKTAEQVTQPETEQPTE